MIFGGQVLETNSAEIMKAVEEISRSAHTACNALLDYIISLSLSLSLSLPLSYKCIPMELINNSSSACRLETASSAINLVPKSVSNWRSR